MLLNTVVRVAVDKNWILVCYVTSRMRGAILLLVAEATTDCGFVFIIVVDRRSLNVRLYRLGTVS